MFVFTWTYIHLCIYTHTHIHAYMWMYMFISKSSFTKSNIYFFVLCKKLFSYLFYSFLIKAVTTTKLISKTQNGLPLEKHWFEKSWVLMGQLEKLGGVQTGRRMQVGQVAIHFIFAGWWEEEGLPWGQGFSGLLTSHPVLVMTDDSKPLNSDREEIFVAFTWISCGSWDQFCPG